MSEDTKAEIQLVLRNDFQSYIQKVFQQLEGNREYQPNWHIERMAWLLEQVYVGRETRVIIPMPPRHLKSICVSVAYTTWLLGQDPTLRIICVSYSDNLAKYFSYLCKSIMETDWYQALFPKTRLSKAKNTQTEIVTSAGGYRLAVSINGSITGRGADYLIVDDPIKAGEAMSKVEREGVNKLFDNTLFSRLDNKEKGRVVITMQRVHSNDLVGHLKKKGGWNIYTLKAIATSDEKIQIGPNRFYTRKKGDPLHAGRESSEVLMKIKKQIGSQNFESQYQQSPECPGHTRILPKHFRLYRRDCELPRFGEVVISWDTASVPGEGNSYSVATVIGILRNQYYILDVIREQLSMPELLKKARYLAARYTVDYMLVEAASSGLALAQIFLEEESVPMIPVRPLQSKMTRLLQAFALLEQKCVVLPDRAPWLCKFKDEIFNFPDCRHNDQVDSLVQFLNWMIAEMPYSERPIIYPGVE